MTLESELKFLDADLEALRPRLEGLGADYEGCWFESNTVYDDDERSLKRGNMLLRIRVCLGKEYGLLTFKQPTYTPSPLKVYEEHETLVTDPEQTGCVLKGLGFSEVLQYQKVRESWRLPGLIVCLDQLPFGNFVEMEGEEGPVLKAAEALGLDMRRASKDTYHALHASWRENVGLDPEESFVFDEDTRERLLREIEHRNLDCPPADKAS